MRYNRLTILSLPEKNIFVLLLEASQTLSPYKSVIYCIIRSFVPFKYNKKTRVAKATLVYGSPCWARTSDIMINSHALYQLS